jgi:protein tyrosine phosphatase
MNSLVETYSLLLEAAWRPKLDASTIVAVVERKEGTYRVFRERAMNGRELAIVQRPDKRWQVFKMNPDNFPYIEMLDYERWIDMGMPDKKFVTFKSLHDAYVQYKDKEAQRRQAKVDAITNKDNPGIDVDL